MRSVYIEVLILIGLFYVVLGMHEFVHYIFIKLFKKEIISIKIK